MYNSDDFDNNSNESFYKVKKVGKKNKVHIGKYDDSDDYIYNSNSFICNARTGFTTNFKVGSSHEDLFFSVIDSSARDKNKNPFVFFFESPEQYERIMRIHYPNFTLSNKTIQNWHKKQMSMSNKI